MKQIGRVTLPFVTGSAKGTKLQLAQNAPYHKMVNNYLELCVQYLISVSCKMLPNTFCIDDKNFTLIALSDHWL